MRRLVGIPLLFAWVFVLAPACLPAAEEAAPPKADTSRILALIKQLGARYLDDRQKAQETLVEIGGGAEPALLKALDEVDVRIRRAACEILGRLKSAGAVPRLLDLLQDPDAHVQETAQAALIRIGPAAFDAIRKAQQDGRISEDRATTLIDQPVKQFVEEALNRCISPDNGMGSYKDQFKDIIPLGPMAVPILLKLFTTPHDRYEFTCSFDGVTGNEKDLSDRKSNIQHLAGEALADVGDRSAVPALTAFTESLEKEVGLSTMSRAMNALANTLHEGRDPIASWLAPILALKEFVETVEDGSLFGVPNPYHISREESTLRNSYETAAGTLMRLGEPARFEKLIAAARKAARATIDASAGLRVTFDENVDIMICQLRALSRLAMLLSKKGDTAATEQIYARCTQQASKQYAALEQAVVKSVVASVEESAKRAAEEERVASQEARMKEEAARSASAGEAKRKAEEEARLAADEAAWKGVKARAAEAMLRIIEEDGKKILQPLSGEEKDESFKRLLMVQEMVAKLLRSQAGLKQLIDNQKDPKRLQELQLDYQKAQKRMEDIEKNNDRMIKIITMLPIAHYNLACALAQLGKKAEAVESLAKAAAFGYDDAGWIQRDGDLNPIRGEAGYRDLVRRLEKKRLQREAQRRGAMWDENH
jgi:hypothetical protein